MARIRPCERELKTFQRIPNSQEYPRPQNCTTYLKNLWQKITAYRYIYTCRNIANIIIIKLLLLYHHLWVVG